MFTCGDYVLTRDVRATAEVSPYARTHHTETTTVRQLWLFENKIAGVDAARG